VYVLSTCEPDASELGRRGPVPVSESGFPGQMHGLVTSCLSSLSTTVRLQRRLAASSFRLFRGVISPHRGTHRTRGLRPVEFGRPDFLGTGRDRERLSKQNGNTVVNSKVIIFTHIQLKLNKELLLRIGGPCRILSGSTVV
jgi:hypothetical protein